MKIKRCDDDVLTLADFPQDGRCERLREINRVLNKPAAAPDDDIREMARAVHSIRAVGRTKKQLGVSTTQAVAFSRRKPPGPNRRYIGIDKSPLYCGSAERQLKTLDGLTNREKVAAIKRFKVADGERMDGCGRMQVESIRARARRAARLSRDRQRLATTATS
jgi:hypothetical protein